MHIIIISVSVITVFVAIENKVIVEKVKLFVATETSQHLNIGRGLRDKLRVYGNAIVVEIAQDTM